MRSWESIFGEVPSSFEDRVQATLAGLEESTLKMDTIKQKARPAYRTALIAAVVAVLLVGTAVAVAVSRIQLVEETQTVQYESTGETSQALVLGFEPTDDAPIHLGVWEIGSVPEGYERADRSYMIVDNGANGGERWENDRGDSVGMTYEAADQLFGQIALDVNHIAEKTEVSVGGSPGTLYRETNGSQLLLWMNEERGIGFILSAASADVDILAVAESVRETGEAPEISEETAAVLEQLGDWTFDDMPEGYELYFSYGYPGDFAYVYRTYENAEHYKIHLSYEAAVYTDDIDACVGNYRELANMAEMYGNSNDDGVRVEKYTISELEVQGMDARLVRYEDGAPVKLMWMDRDSELVFSLSGDGLDAEALISLADSVVRQ